MVIRLMNTIICICPTILNSLLREDAISIFKMKFPNMMELKPVFRADDADWRRSRSEAGIWAGIGNEEESDEGSSGRRDEISEK